MKTGLIAIGERKICIMDNQRNNDICVVTEPEELIVADPVVGSPTGWPFSSLIDVKYIMHPCLVLTLRKKKEKKKSLLPMI